MTRVSSPDDCIQPPGVVSSSDMRRRISFIALFLALCVLAAAGWIVEAIRWTVTLGGGSAREHPVARPAR